MKYLLLIATVTLLMLHGCANTARNPADESILDVINQTDAALRSTTTGCAAGDVTYCVQAAAGRQCQCMNYSEVQSRLNRFAPR